LDEDFVITTAGWLDQPAAKQDWIDELAARHLLEDFNIHTVDVRDMGNVAIVLVLSTQSATWKGAAFTGRFRYTDVWCQNDAGTWRLAVRHASLLPST
jgi:ketosteroid isomerase-like protein